MNQFELLVDALRKKFPEATIKVGEPEKTGGNYWLDITQAGKRVTLEHRPGKGFGFFAKSAGYGEGPNKIVSDHAEALVRIVKLLKHKHKASKIKKSRARKK
jgi:hypothetical protein